MIDQLQTQIRLVAELRASAQKARAAQIEARVAWETANDGIIRFANFAAQNVEEAEAVLRELTLQVYAETGDKHPCEGVGIRESEKLVYDPALALSYAKEHGVAIKLDTASFEKMAKISELRPRFVTIEKVVTATIATVLEVK